MQQVTFVMRNDEVRLIETLIAEKQTTLRNRLERAALDGRGQRDVNVLLEALTDLGNRVRHARNPQARNAGWGHTAEAA